MRRLLLPLIPLLLLCSPAPAAGLELDRKYEAELVRWAMAREGLEPEPAPGSKVIARVVVVREEIIAESDPWPNFLNWFHYTTRDSVVRQELLIGKGKRWDQDLVEESERNLRKLFILAVARVVPCKGQRPGELVMLVVTKDLWSIRLNTEFSQVGSILQKFDWFPTEQNFLGLNKRLSLHLQLSQLDLGSFTVFDKFALGNIYVDERLLGSRIKLVQRFDAIVAGEVPCGGSKDGVSGAWCPDRELGDLEGIYGYLWLTRPLFSLATKWGFSVIGLVSTGQQRLYAQPGPVLRAVSVERFTGRKGDTVPRVYDRERYEVAADVTRSFGREVKHDLNWGLAAYRLRYTAPDGFPYPDEVKAWFTRIFLPRSEAASYLHLRYRTHNPKFIRVKNIKSLGLSEDLRLGHDVTVELRGAVGMADFEPLYLELQAVASYRWQLGQDLVTLKLGGRGRWQPSIEDEGFSDPWANAHLEAEASNISPPVPGGRFHTRAGVRLRHHDLTRARSFLGGDNGLRGYPSKQFEGNNLWYVNAEFRSNPINILTLHIGLALFYDGGAVWGGPDPLDPDQELAHTYRQSIGVGLRALFPQFDREPLRVDFGIPLSDGADSVGTWFSLGFKQIF